MFQPIGGCSKRRHCHSQWVWYSTSGIEPTIKSVTATCHHRVCAEKNRSVIGTPTAARIATSIGKARPKPKPPMKGVIARHPENAAIKTVTPAGANGEMMVAVHLVGGSHYRLYIKLRRGNDESGWTSSEPQCPTDGEPIGRRGKRLPQLGQMYELDRVETLARQEGDRLVRPPVFQ